MIMKICILSEYSGVLDEGMRNIAFHISKELSRHHEVLHLCLRPLGNVFSRTLWKKIQDFSPQIIHLIPGPTIKTFLLMKFFKLHYPQAKKIMSATNPVIGYFSEKFIPLFKPDLILTQSNKSQRMFTRLGCNTHFLPSGVDTERFVAVSKEAKRRLRARFQLDEEKFIALHIGPIRRSRDILIFNRIAKETNIQVLIVGSLSTPLERDTCHSLMNGGCLVWRTYLRNIAEIYAFSDCYVFPTLHRGSSIEMPLSVLEAMSCNLPIVSTKFGALPEVFAEGEGLHYVDAEDETILALNQIKESEEKVKTREKVLPYSWKNVAKRLEHLYDEQLEK